MPTVGFGTIILAVFFDCIIPLTAFAISNIPTADIPTAAFYTLPLIVFYIPPLIVFYNFPSPVAFYTPPPHSPSAALYTPPPSYTAPTVLSHTLQPAASDTTNTTRILFSSSPTILPLPQPVISTNFNTIAVFVLLLHTIAVIADV
jgi:hypothetical protein